MRSPLAVAALLCSLAAAGCASSPADPGHDDYRIVEGYDARRPVDVAVLPVAGELPLASSKDLRTALRDALLARRYAPIRSQEVDRHPENYRVGGSYAVLEVRVTGWDESRVFADGTVRVSAEARLYAPGGLEVLYLAVLDAVPVGGEASRASHDDRDRAQARAAAALATRLLERLPVKGDG